MIFCNRCGDAVEEGCDPRVELVELDALLKRLALKRYDLKRKINRFHSPIVRLLPPDVMSTIFEFCLPDFTDRQVSQFTKEDLFIPLFLGAICSYWRDIAWSTPSLWSSLVVTDKYISHVAAGIAQEWLVRSGQLPLSIRIYSEHLEHEVVSALADIVNQYSNRWSNLDLHIPDFCYRYFHGTDNHAPNLKVIRFYSSKNTKGLNFQLTCPRLERASLTCFPVDGINIQWDNLTHLTIKFMFIDERFLVILRKTPRLVFCKVEGCWSQYGGQTIAPVLTSLRTLRLMYSSFVEDFLNHLIAPHLEEFSSLDCHNSSTEVIASFLRRSSCSLRSFTMIFSIRPPYFESFMNFLQSMPSLNTLSIRSINTYSESATSEDYDPRNLFQLLAKVLSSQSTSLQQGFLPNLKILEYIGELHLFPGNYEDLYSLPPADNAVHGPLSLFNLDLYPANRIPKNMISYVSSLVERGITVNVSSGSEDILQSSIDYYRHREDPLCRDWADNLDSSLFS